MHTLALALIFLAAPQETPTEKAPKTVEIVLTKAEEKRLKEASPITYEKLKKDQSLDVYDIKVMTRVGIPDQIIIAAIDKTHSMFYINSLDIKELRQAGVSQKVIESMSETGKYNYN